MKKTVTVTITCKRDTNPDEFSRVKKMVRQEYKRVYGDEILVKFEYNYVD